MGESVKVTGKIKTTGSKKGMDVIVFENINIPDGDAAMLLKRCANNEEAVEITISPLQKSFEECE